MSATFKPTNLLKTYTGGSNSVQVDVAGKSVRECLAIIKIPAELVALVVVNGKAETKDYIVQDGDTIQLIPLVGGG